VGAWIETNKQNMLKQVVRYNPATPDGESRTRLLDGTVRGHRAGYKQTLTVICEWATELEIQEAVNEYFPGILENNTDVAGVFCLNGEPNLEPVVTNDYPLYNCTLTGTAMFADSTLTKTPNTTPIYGSI